jgi:hypothetical protein
MPQFRDYTLTNEPSDPPFGGLFSLAVPDLHRIPVGHLLMISVSGLYPDTQAQFPQQSGLLLIVVPDLHRIAGTTSEMTSVRDCTRTIKPSDPPCDGLFLIVVPDLHRIVEAI